MNKTALTLLLFIICLTFTNSVISQNPFQSDYLIKYDLATHKTDKPIPFDHSFTLIVEKISSKNIDRVQVFEAGYNQGKRQLSKNSFTDCDGQKVKQAIVDMELKFNPYSDTLQIFFPPLRPNIDFDIMLFSYLQPSNRNSLLRINSLISTSNYTAAESAFNDLFLALRDDIFGRTLFSIFSFEGYKDFYTAKLASHYTTISDVSKFATDGTLTEDQVRAIDIATSAAISDFRNGDILMEASKRNLWPQIQNGLIDINNVFLTEKESLTNMHTGHIRLKNMESSIAFFDSVFKRLDRVISKTDGIVTITPGATPIIVNDLRTAINTIKNNLKANYSLLGDEMGAINKEIDLDKRIRQGSYLAGNTLSSDLKTAGGNVLFLDAGFTNIIVPGVTNKAVYIPKLYFGASIYFRPIDKNTRRSRFPCKKNLDPKKYYGCHKEVLSRNADGSVKEISEPMYGPDYGVATKWDIRQHLCLNIGITLGAMQNKDFDNLYNSTSLLVGPAYRIARGFKVSAGVALLKRTSKNPIISEKRVVPGGYFSASVDMDFIQSLQDIKNILFK